LFVVISRLEDHTGFHVMVGSLTLCYCGLAIRRVLLLVLFCSFPTWSRCMTLSHTASHTVSTVIPIQMTRRF